MQYPPSFFKVNSLEVSGKVMDSPLVQSKDPKKVADSQLKMLPTIAPQNRYQYVVVCFFICFMIYFSRIWTIAPFLKA